MNRVRILLPIAAVVLALSAWAATRVSRAPGEGYTFLVSGSRSTPVRAGAFFFRPPGAGARHVPASGSFRFPGNDPDQFFSRDDAELPVQLDVTWRLSDAAPAAAFAASGGDSFERHALRGPVREALRTAAARLTAEEVFASRGESLRREVASALRLPPGIDAAVAVASLTMSPTAQRELLAADRPVRRVLFIGVDAMDWEILKPLRAAGRVPTFDRLVREGTSTGLGTLTPMLSPLIWTSMATGVGPEKHGILDFFTVDPATGESIPVTGRLRRVPAFWNVATFFGRSLDVVGWLATWPAERIRGRMVSDRAGFLAFASPEHGGAELPEAVYPAAEAAAVLAATVQAQSVSPATVRRFLDVSPAEIAAAREGGFTKGNLINNFILTYATAHSYAAIGRRYAAEGADLTAVYFEYIDAVCHLFMPYAAPRQDWVSDADFTRYGDAVAAAYEDMDRIAGELIAAAGDSTVVIVASDHGFLSGDRRLPGEASMEGAQAGRWHRDPGVLVLHGPGVRRGATLDRASVMDIAPTLLYLMGVPVSSEMEGRVLADAFTEKLLSEHPVRRVDAYLLPPDIWTPPASAAGTDAAGGAEAERPKVHINLGLVLEEKGQFAEAEAEYRKALALDPRNPNARNNLANVLQKTGRLEEALELYLALMADNPDYRTAYRNVGTCYLRMGNAEAAMPWFDKTVAAEPGNVAGRLARGEAHLHLRDHAAAESDFREALRLDPNAADAHYGMGVIAAERGDLAEARRELVRALSLDPNHQGARDGLARLGGAR